MPGILQVTPPPPTAQRTAPPSQAQHLSDRPPTFTSFRPAAATAAAAGAAVACPMFELLFILVGVGGKQMDCHI